MDKDAKIYVAGHRGMVGSAIVRELNRQGYRNLIVRTHGELDLTRQADVEQFFKDEKPEYVFLAAAKVGGILANIEAPADFMYVNTMIEMNVIRAAYENGCKKLLFMGSGCIYPHAASQPLKESYLLTGELEPTNEGYALAKIAGLRYCEYLNRQYGTNYISVMPANIYGLNDNYHPKRSHVLPAFIRRFHQAKVENAPSVTCLGDGTATRDFLYVDDLAEFCLFLMNHYNDPEIINAASGVEVSIKELAETVARIVGYEGEIKWDTSQPNGMPRKVLDSSKAAALGWRQKTSLDDGIRLSYEDYIHRVLGAEVNEKPAPSVASIQGNKIGIGWAYVSDVGKKYVNAALDAGRLSQGDMVHRFEKEFAQLHDQKYGIALNSGTSALHVGLEALKEKFNWFDGRSVIDFTMGGGCYAA